MMFWPDALVKRVAEETLSSIRADKALQAGCNDYDTKPVDLPRLLGKIEALLSNPPTANP